MSEIFAYENSQGINALLENALRFHQEADLVAAEMLYYRILKTLPDSDYVLYLLGTLNLQRNDYQMAFLLLQKAINLNPDNAEAQCNLGNTLFELGKFDQAIVSYKKAIKGKQNFFEAYYNMANCLMKMGRIDEAIKTYSNAIAINKDSAASYNNLGLALMEKGNFEETEICYKHALKLQPNNAEVFSNLGNTYKAQNRLDEAKKCYGKAIELEPDFADAYNNLGSLLQKQQNLSEAVSNYRHALKLKPDYPDAYNNLGSALQEQDNLEAAVECYKAAIAVKNNYPEAHNNLGNAFKEMGELDAAIKSFNQAIKLDFNYAMAHWNKALTLLLQGNLQQGWQEYEWRFKAVPGLCCKLEKPRWQGEPFLGKERLLIHAEQGIGDTLQFMRYLPLIKRMGVTLILECHKSISRLLQAVPGVDELVEKNELKKQELDYDLEVPLLSLPGIFMTNLNTVPTGIPYILPNANMVEEWRAWLSKYSGYKIGIVWSGNPLHKHDKKRSCPLSYFKPLLDIPGRVLFSLQKGIAAEQARHEPWSNKMVNMEDKVNDFADTAAIIANLDLVISVDTAVAHLAGAMGKTVWTLLPYAPDWRWLLNRNNSPWYPTMRLFRQPSPGDWTSVIDSVTNEVLLLK